MEALFSHTHRLSFMSEDLSGGYDEKEAFPTTFDELKGSHEKAESEVAPVHHPRNGFDCDFAETAPKSS